MLLQQLGLLFVQSVATQSKVLHRNGMRARSCVYLCFAGTRYREFFIPYNCCTYARPVSAANTGCSDFPNQTELAQLDDSSKLTVSVALVEICTCMRYMTLYHRSPSSRPLNSAADLRQCHARRGDAKRSSMASLPHRCQDYHTDVQEAVQRLRPPRSTGTSSLISYW